MRVVSVAGASTSLDAKVFAIRTDILRFLLTSALPTLLILMLCIAACGPNQREESIAGIVVPIPAKMSKAPEDPIQVSLPGFNAGKMVYRGSVDPGSILKFYQDEMPKRGWEPKGTLLAGGGVLAYKKGPISVLISVSSADSGTMLAILVGRMGTEGLEAERGPL